MLLEVTDTVAFGREGDSKHCPEIIEMDSSKREFLIIKDKQLLIHYG